MNNDDETKNLPTKDIPSSSTHLFGSSPYTKKFKEIYNAGPYSSRLKTSYEALVYSGLIFDSSLSEVWLQHIEL